MTVLPIKPALFAGFLLLTTLPVVAQDYVDVEAERTAAAQAVVNHKRPHQRGTIRIRRGEAVAATAREVREGDGQGRAEEEEGQGEGG